ncbi:DUF6090 family protein [Ichthyenterobacterium sp. W332]|uniref:DUF6090 family protein n=1 Tax=Microcosmobacter mediterraneus TaxID=3075607 RepID=A0ABU2YLP9_9FLAO|nr:DUF6090 family protein [Ichthyenterobacterium sp. W332]MDT0558750.1 DUF6090 family protein [Ichthyenterobacterium sp. W332]
MIRIFRKLRHRLLFKNKFSRYILYAFGEIALVVIGILVAIQINNWNRDNTLYSQELEAYDLIIKDLKRDSILFQRYNKGYSAYLDTFFKLNAVKKNNSSLDSIFTDHICSNAEFNPSVQKNNLPIIEKLRNQDVRDRINNYFRRLNLVHQASGEYNKLINETSRPFFIEEHNIFNNSAVFENDDKRFPPLKGVSVIDTIQLRKSFSNKYFTPIISELRMSMGFYLTALELSIKDNSELIQMLNNELK